MRREYIGPSPEPVRIGARRSRRRRGPTARSEPVRGARRAQREEHDDERRERHHAHLAAHDRRDDRVLLGLGQLADRLGVSQVALVEDRLRRGDPQLLGDERDRERQQRVEVEEAFARVVAGQPPASRPRARRPAPSPGRRAAAPRSAPCSLSPRYQRQPPSRPGSALSAATASAPATTARQRAHRLRHAADIEPIATM